MLALHLLIMQLFLHRMVLFQIMFIQIPLLLIWKVSFYFRLHAQNFLDKKQLEEELGEEEEVSLKEEMDLELGQVS